MGQDPQETVAEIEETREELARKVDELVVRAKVEASALGKKAALAAVAVAGILVVGWIAKRRVER